MGILIFEDEIPASNRLQKLIAEINPNAEIMGVLDSIRSAVSFLKENTPDFIVSDVELADGLCFEIFKETETTVPIIFTTAYNQYAIRAFEANAIDYLLKPVNRADLAKAFKKLEQRMGLPREIIDFKSIANAISSKELLQTKRYLVKYGTKMFVVNPNDAAYFYSIQKSSFMVTPEGKSYPLDESLSTIERDLDPVNFFRINRNAIINISSIESMKSYSKSRVQVNLTPEFENEKFCIVSSERSPQFRKWLKGTII